MRRSLGGACLIAELETVCAWASWQPKPVSFVWLSSPCVDGAYLLFFSIFENISDSTYYCVPAACHNISTCVPAFDPHSDAEVPGVIQVEWPLSETLESQCVFNFVVWEFGIILWVIQARHPSYKNQKSEMIQSLKHFEQHCNAHI